MQEPPPFNGVPNPNKPPMLGGVPPQAPPPILGKESSQPPPRLQAIPPVTPPAIPPRLPANTPPPPPLATPPQPPSRPLAAQPPKEFKPARNANRGLKVGFIIATAGFLLVCVLGIAVVFAKRANHREFAHKDTAEDYVLLCANLLDKIKLVDGVEPSEAELTVLARNRRDNFIRIAAEGAELGGIAQSILSESEKAYEVLTNLPNGRAFLSGTGDVITGLNSNSNDQVWSGLAKALPEVARGLEAYGRIEESLNFRHGVAINLAKLAPKFSGPPTNGATFGSTFTEHRPGFLELDTAQSLNLTNTSDSDLHNCVILVRLSDPEGKAYVNVHYAPVWPKTGTLTTRYLTTEVFTKALENTSRVDVNVWTREASFETIVLMRPQGGWPELR